MNYDDRYNFFIEEDPYMATESGADGYVAQRQPDSHSTPKMIGAIISAAVAVVFLSSFILMLFLKPTHTASAVISEGDEEINVTDQRAGITLPIYIPELDNRGSRIPVSITGTLADGSGFAKETYVAKDGSGLLLEPGSYELQVSGSPISSAGVMYKAPDESIKIEVSDDLVSSYSPDGFMDFSVIAALDITDEQIDAACDLIRKDPERTQYADSIAEAVRGRRDEAIAANKAAEAAKVEAVRVTSEQQIADNIARQLGSVTQSSQQNEQDGAESVPTSGTSGNSSGYSGYEGNSESSSVVTEDQESSENYGGGSGSGYSSDGNESDSSEEQGQTSDSGTDSESSSAGGGSSSGESNSSSDQSGNSSGGSGSEVESAATEMSEYTEPQTA